MCLRRPRPLRRRRPCRARRPPLPPPTRPVAGWRRRGARASGRARGSRATRRAAGRRYAPASPPGWRSNLPELAPVLLSEPLDLGLQRGRRGLGVLQSLPGLCQDRAGFGVAGDRLLEGLRFDDELGCEVELHEARRLREGGRPFLHERGELRELSRCELGFDLHIGVLGRPPPAALGELLDREARR